MKFRRWRLKTTVTVSEGEEVDPPTVTYSDPVFSRGFARLVARAVLAKLEQRGCTGTCEVERR